MDQTGLLGTEIILQETGNQGRTGHRLTDWEDDVQSTHALGPLRVRSAGNISQDCEGEGRR